MLEEEGGRGQRGEGGTDCADARDQQLLAHVSRDEIGSVDRDARRNTEGTKGRERKGKGKGKGKERGRERMREKERMRRKEEEEYSGVWMSLVALDRRSHDEKRRKT